MGGYGITDPVYKALGSADDDPSTQLSKIMSPMPAAQLVGPPPDSPPPGNPGESTRRTGTLAAPPQQAVAKNLDTEAGKQSYNLHPAIQAQQAASPIGALQRPSQAASAPQPSMPASLSPSGAPMLPQQTPQLVKPDALNMQTQQDQDRRAALIAQGSPISRIQSPLLKALAGIGDVGLHALAPNIAPLVKGSTDNYMRNVGIATQNVGQDQGQQQARAQLEDTESQAAQRQAQAGANVPRAVTADEAKAAGNPALEGSLMRPSDIGKLNVQSVKNTGQIDKQDDPDSVAAHNAQTLGEVRRTQEALNNAKAELAAAGNDPNSPAYKLAKQKAGTASANAAAAMIRAKAYSLNANVGNLGVDNNGNPVNGINTLGGAPMGTRVAPQAAKAMGNLAKFQDVYSSIDNTNAALDEADKAGAKFNTAAMAAALSDPKTTAAQWATGKINTTLTPQEQNLVITTKALREQINAMRSSVGGGVSDSQINRLVDQLPSATTPDMGYARKQLATVRQQLDRLQGGLPGVHNGPTLQAPGSPANPTNPGGVPKGIPRGNGLVGPVRPGEKVAIGPNGHQIVARGNKWVDPTNGKEVK